MAIDKPRITEYLGRPQSLEIPEGLIIEFFDSSPEGIGLSLSLATHAGFDATLGPISIPSLKALGRFLQLMAEREELLARIPKGENYWREVAQRLGKKALGERELTWEDYLAEQSRAS